MARKKKTVTPEELIENTKEVILDEGDEEKTEPSADAVSEADVVEEDEKAEEAEDSKEDEKVEEAEDSEEDEKVEEAEDSEEDEKVEESEAIEEIEDVNEDVAEGADEAEAESVDTEAVEALEEVAEQIVAESEEEAPSPSEFMNIEHFADYRRKDEIDGDEEELDEKEAEYAELDDEGDDDYTDDLMLLDGVSEEDEFYEYENLTILDEIVEEPAEEEVVEDFTPSKDEEPYDAKKPRKVDARFDFIELFVCMMAVIMLLSAFVFRHSVVDGGSMEPTLYNGEHLIISNFFYEPKQYDIIVCEDYTTGLMKPIIKRVIATEGQTVKVVAMDEVYVDEVLVDKSFILIDGKEDLVYGNVYPIEYVVPEGEVFVMGDHRNSSLDSRLLGTIDEDTILGKVVLRFYPFDRFGKVK